MIIITSFKLKQKKFSAHILHIHNDLNKYSFSADNIPLCQKNILLGDLKRIYLTVLQKPGKHITIA